MMPNIIKRRTVALQYLVILFCISGIGSSCLAQGTIYASGTYTGTTTWRADTVKVTGGVLADTLIIGPGTVVEFQDGFGLHVNKFLDARGELGDTILFTTKDTTGFSDPNTSLGGWAGIGGRRIQLKYCKIQYVKKINLRFGVINCEQSAEISNSSIINNRGTAMIFEFSIIHLNDCIIRNNSEGGIFSHSFGRLFIENSIVDLNGKYGIRAVESNKLFIKNCIIQHNKGSGVEFHAYEFPFKGIISNNIIRFNDGYGLELDMFRMPVVNNLITGNSKAGLFIINSSNTLVNNTIIYNSNGIFTNGSGLIMYNSICRNNNKNPGDQNINNYAKIINCNIEGINPDIFYDAVNCIDADPLFADTASFDFHLSDMSPCINAGTMDTTGLFLPETDIGGPPRIIGGRIDIGAYEYQQEHHNIYVNGTCTGTTTWSADTVKVTGNVTVDSLMIEAGTVVEFQGRYGLTVNKYFDAKGTIEDTVLFTIKDTTGFSDPDVLTGGWGGIWGTAKFMLNYCKVEYVKLSKNSRTGAAITASYNMIEIFNCSITNNSTKGIYSEGQLTIQNSLIAGNNGEGITQYGLLKVNDCIIRDNSAGGIHSYGKLFVENSTIESNGQFGIRASEPMLVFVNNNHILKNNGFGIVIYDLESPSRGIVSNNKISFNTGYGLSAIICDLKIMNNLIYNNGSAGVHIDIDYHYGSLFINNTIKNNSNGIILNDAVLNMFNCICRDNDKKAGEQNIFSENHLRRQEPEKGNIYHSNINRFNPDDLKGEFIDNIDSDPLFADTANCNFRLTDFSPCINAGTIDTLGLFLPETDLDGNPRIFDGRIDMGAYEYQQDNFQIVKQPVSQVICEGAAVILETEAIGGVMGYQWQKNGTDIPLASQGILSIDTIRFADSGYYNCLIIADDKTVSTDTIVLSVPNPQPPVSNDVTLCEGEPVPDLTASGDHIRWYDDAGLTNPVDSGNTFYTGRSDPGVYNYYVTQTVSGCESNTGTVKLKINSLPSISLGEDSTITTSQTIVLGPFCDCYSYLWNDNSENPYLELSGNTLGIGSHSISVQITDSNNCRNSDTMTVDVAPITNINRTRDDSQLHIFPNPTYGIITIEVSDVNERNFLVKLFNQQGEELVSNKINVENASGIIQLNLSSFPPGIYYLQTLASKGQHFVKVVLQ